MTRDKNKHLLSLPMFWFATMTPLVVCVILMVIIFYLDDLSLAVWNSVNIGIAYTHFKVPLVIASLAFPLGAVMIASHRSAQTLMMADLQSSQNRFANYFLHLDRFIAEMTAPEVKLLFVNTRAAHDALYPDLLSKGSLSANTEHITRFTEAVQKIEVVSKNIRNSLPKKIHVTPIESISSSHRDDVMAFFNSTEALRAIDLIIDTAFEFDRITSDTLKTPSWQPTDMTDVWDLFQCWVIVVDELLKHDGSSDIAEQITFTGFFVAAYKQFVNYQKEEAQIF
ncbi:hypothetical protein H4J45_07420 [Colwellia sp. BRX10-6]|uniref:hypothetical protein n=1 Tax=unclassified Colwellia TaxID=196834 RepID=UPI0015F7800F|nr:MULTISPECIES: hypothetical protein [unclassified Colwellia]MBA6353176.1 hypothetical protein [Colwellia sp. BRX9-1]MBA6383842.1 hypothetical protein [Colwellia sp. BRX10-9]MBA6393916.1 hypothetical protein [Colwellia sp. BRX10-6]